jgi:hypothetical protein
MPHKKLIKVLSVFFCFVACLVNASAQEDCKSTLDKAQKQYENGIIEDIPQMLAPCIENGFSDEERLQAYKLIILSCLFDQNTEDADKGMLSFLKKYPEYQLTSDDPAEFAQEFQAFQSLPFISVGGSAGTNFTYPYVIKSYVTNGLGNRGEYGNSGVGFQVGGILNFYLAQHWELNVEPSYLRSKYKYSLTLSNLETISSTESQSKVELPVCVTYIFGNGVLRPYLKAGCSLDYLFNATSKKKLVYTSVSSEISSSDMNVLSDRRQFNFSGMFGGGIRYKIPKGFVFFDVRWTDEILNQVAAGNRYNNEATFKYQNPDDDLLINNLFLSVGYVHSFFKPVKKR